MQRKPKGYVGTNHETKGSDILSILKVLHLPEVTLGKELAAELKAVKPDSWYPIGKLLQALELLEKKLDAYALRSVGWAIIKQSHEANIREHFTSARDLLGAFDAIYKNVNRGTAIGGWRLVSFEPTKAVLEKTTPHQCVMEEGIVEEALRTIGVSPKVRQTKCFRSGAETCVYEIVPSTTDERWNGRGA